MAAVDPNNNLALMDVVNARSGLGDLLRQQNQIEAAVASYRKLVDAAERLNSDGVRVFSNIDAGIQAHHRLGLALTEMGHFDEALEHFQKAANYLLASEKLNPDLNRNHRHRAELDAGRAEVFKRQGSWRPAITAFSSAIKGYEGQRQRDPKDETLLGEQPALYTSLAECYAALGESNEAAQAARNSLERYREIESARPLVEEEQKARTSTVEKLAQWTRAAR
jgi:tetratricopeptide (TPR) repeat protein